MNKVKKRRQYYGNKAPKLNKLVESLRPENQRPLQEYPGVPVMRPKPGRRGRR